MVVDVAPMPEPYHDDQQHVVLDGIDDAVIPDPNTEARTSLQGTCSRWARILREQCDGALDTSPNLRVELVQGPGSRRAKLDAVDAHSQPRSALT